VAVELYLEMFPSMALIFNMERFYSIVGGPEPSETHKKWIPIGCEVDYISSVVKLEPGIKSRVAGSG
jgi:hypothetical protein